MSTCTTWPTGSPRRLRLIITEGEELAQADREVRKAEEVFREEDAPMPDDFLALFGSIHAPADFAERHDDYASFCPRPS